MATPIVLPSFGMYTAEGTLVNWLHPSGTHLQPGQGVAEIETEKATQELPAPAGGILHQVAQVGTLLKEQDLIGYILAEGEPVPGKERPVASPAPAAPTAASPPATPAAAATAVAVAPVAAAGSDFLKASPAARKLAAQHGLDLTQVQGTGPGGRIVEADVLARLGPTLAPSPAPAAVPALEPPVRERRPLSAKRRTIGERLRQSLNAAVSLTLTRAVEADRLVAARKDLSARLNLSIPYDAFFAKFLAVGLREHPDLNAMVQDGTLALFEDVNVAVATAVSDGLVVPVVRQVDRLPLASVAAQIRALAERARTSGLRPEDSAGGTTTITNLGAFGIDAFTPVLNPPQTCILGIGRIQPRPVVRSGAVVVVPTCALSLTFDHRVTDGVPAAQLLDGIARRMNDEAFLTSLG